jgi:hypothetical protein
MQRVIEEGWTTPGAHDLEGAFSGVRDELAIPARIAFARDAILAITAVGGPRRRARRDYLERVTRQPDVGVAKKAFDRVMRGTLASLYLAGIFRS